MLLVCLGLRAYCLIAESSSSILISSETSTPPVFSGALKSMPKSLRLILVVASKLKRVLPNGSSAVATSSTSRSTDLVVSLMVRSPVTVPLPFPSTLRLVALKVISGYCSGQVLGSGVSVFESGVSFMAVV